MKHVLFAVALVAGTLGLAGSAAAAITVPKAYSGKNALIAFTRANPPHSPQLTGVTRGHAPQVVVKGGHLVAGPVHANVVAAAGASGYLDQAAPGVRFTFVKTYFNVPSVSGSTGCNGNPCRWLRRHSGSRIAAQTTEAGVAEIGCNGVTTADFFYNVAGYGAFYYSGVNPGDAVEASITVNRTSEYVLQVKDLSTGGLLQVTMGCQVSSCPDSTAGVVSQPSNLTGGVMPDFTMINYTGSAVSGELRRVQGEPGREAGEVDERGAGGTKPIRSHTVCATRRAGVQQHLGKLRQTHDLWRRSRAATCVRRIAFSACGASAARGVTSRDTTGSDATGPDSSGCAHSIAISARCTAPARQPPPLQRPG